MNIKKNIILFFGPPGSGKGTQSDVLGKKLKLPVISPGELLRAEEEAKTDLGLAVAEKLAHGQLVPDEIIENILNKRLKQSDTVNGFILDGYPRNESQLNSFKNRLLRTFDTRDRIIAIAIKVSDGEVENRVEGRRVCNCGAAYHLKYNPPKVDDKCDLCGRALVQREDDKPEIIKKRLVDFHEIIKPIVAYFCDNYICFEINGEQSINIIEDEIYNQVKGVFNKLNS
jgi:adenylate kinase